MLSSRVVRASWYNPAATSSLPTFSSKSASRPANSKKYQRLPVANSCPGEGAATVAFALKGTTPRQVAERLGQEGIFVWDGNYYALAVTERLGGGKRRHGCGWGSPITIRQGKWSGCWLWLMTWPVILDNERNHLINPAASCEERTGPASLAGPVVFG
jgi:hypothetical protein